MNPEKQRIAIAEACGWKRKERSHGVLGRWTSMDWVNPQGEFDDLPDHLNDLNAMHEAEKKLKAIPCGPSSFIKHLLFRICADYDEPLNTDSETVWCSITATAAQRAEAFLRTVGKWEDE